MIKETGKGEHLNRFPDLMRKGKGSHPKGGRSSQAHLYSGRNNLFWFFDSERGG